MEESNYYTPKIEELFVGYECLYFEPHSPNQWEPYIWEDSDIVEKIEDINHIKANFRTPYLTKEQIEAEGWKVISDYGAGTEFRYFYKDQSGEFESDYTLQTNKHAGILYPKEQIIIRKDIARIFNSDQKEIIFKGNCKSINEFRKIIQWLNINND